MNVYDFDGTIYNGDSTVDFFLYAVRHKPSVLRYLPKQAGGFALYGAKRIDKTALKETFFCFLPAIDAGELSESFWDSHEKKIYGWYRDQQREDDILISASPRFLLEPLCKRLHIRHLIASEVDPKTGIFTGSNCRGEEKVRRLEAEFPGARVDRFYSDSLSDWPLAKIADKAYLVKRGAISQWKRQ